MPKISDINLALEKKIDLTDFFGGEETFITIKRMDKYRFSYLLNKNRNSYSNRLYKKIQDWRTENPDAESIPTDVYDQLKLSISPEEAQEGLLNESEVDRAYYEYSIQPDKHNFVDNEDKLIPITGEWFYEQFSSLTNQEGRSLNDVVINSIVNFNHTGIVMGEQTASKSTVS